MSDSEHNARYIPSSSRFPWGCLLGGCATVVLLMLALAIGSGVVGYYFVKGQVVKYSSETPRELPSVEYSPEEVKEITDRIDSFKTSLQKGDPPSKLELKADDINALISENKELSGKVFVRVDKGKVTADVSIPTDILPIPGAKGRYFNGSVSTNVSLEKGVLIVTLQDAEVNGQKVPDEFMKAVRNENLAKEMYKDPEVAKALGKFESLVIEGDTIILTPRADLPNGASTNGASTTENPAN